MITNDHAVQSVVVELTISVASYAELTLEHPEMVSVDLVGDTPMVVVY